MPSDFTNGNSLKCAKNRFYRILFHHRSIVLAASISFNAGDSHDFFLNLFASVIYGNKFRPNFGLYWTYDFCPIL